MFKRVQNCEFQLFEVGEVVMLCHDKKWQALLPVRMFTCWKAFGPVVLGAFSLQYVMSKMEAMRPHEAISGVVGVA